jgi:outer membrane protein assembly factor BamD (BamD/ComL family)
MMSRYDDAARVLGRVSRRCPGTEVAEKADFERAHSLEVGGKRSDAAQAYGTFIEKYPNSRRIKLATRSYDLLK